MPNLPLTSRQVIALTEGAAHPFGAVRSTRGVIDALHRRGYLIRTGPETGRMTGIGLVAIERRQARP